MKRRLRVYQALMLVAIFAVWQLLTQPDLIPPVMWADNPTRAAFFFNYAVSTLDASPTRTLTRPLVLLLAYAFQRPSIDAAGIPSSSVGDIEFGTPCRFVAYKDRLKRKALICAGICMTASVLTILALL